MEDDAPRAGVRGRLSVDWHDTNTALAATVIGAVVGLVLIRRGFRGFALAT